MWAVGLYDLLTPGRERERFRVLRPLDALTLEPSIRADDLQLFTKTRLVLGKYLSAPKFLSSLKRGALFADREMTIYFDDTSM